MFVDRDPDREVGYLVWRIRLFGAGAILGLAGIWTDTGWLVTLAIAVLVVGFALRFVPEKGDGVGSEDERSGKGGARADGERDGAGAGAPETGEETL